MTDATEAVDPQCLRCGSAETIQRGMCAMCRLIESDDPISSACDLIAQLRAEVAGLEALCEKWAGHVLQRDAKIVHLREELADRELEIAHHVRVSVEAEAEVATAATRERERIVAWLRAGIPTIGDTNSWQLDAATLANTITRGEHLKGGTE